MLFTHTKNQKSPTEQKKPPTNQNQQNKPKQIQPKIPQKTKFKKPLESLRLLQALMQCPYIRNGLGSDQWGEPLFI